MDYTKFNSTQYREHVVAVCEHEPTWKKAAAEFKRYTTRTMGITGHPFTRADVEGRLEMAEISWPAKWN